MATRTTIRGLDAAYACLKELGMGNGQIDKIIDYLQTRLGTPCLIPVDAEAYDNTSGGKTVRLAMEPFSPGELGVLRFMLRKCSLTATFYIRKDENESTGKYSVSLSFVYEHPDGGRNGHDLSFSLHGQIGGRFQEVNNR